MIIKDIDQNKYFEATLRFWDGEQWQPDCFSDLENNFAVGKEIENSTFAVCAKTEQINDMVDWWKEEVKWINNGLDGSYLGTLSKKQFSNGCEWEFLVEEIDV